EMAPTTPISLFETQIQKSIFTLPSGPSGQQRPYSQVSIEQKMITLENKLNQMLTTEPVIIDKLQLCLSQLLDLTSQIPAENVEFLDVWSDKAADLASKLAIVHSTGKPLEPTEVKTTKESIRAKLEIAFARLT